MGMLNRRQDSTIEMIAATRGRASLLPMRIQFFGYAYAGERSAVTYSIIESCRRHGVEPYCSP